MLILSRQENGDIIYVLALFTVLFSFISSSFSSHKTANELRKELQKLCELLSGEIQAKKQRQQSLMAEILRKENNLAGKKMPANERRR